MAENKQQDLSALGETHTNKYVPSESLQITALPMHSGTKGQPLAIPKTISPRKTPRRARNLSITVAQTAPIAKAKRRWGNSDDDDQDEDMLATANGYNTRARRRLELGSDATVIRTLTDPTRALVPAPKVSKRSLAEYVVDGSEAASSSPAAQQNLGTTFEPVAQARPKFIVKPPFRLLDRIMRHPEVILRLSSIMEVKNLLDLYAISKPFHFILNSHHTTYIRSSAEVHAPDSGYIFPWRCYRRLTIKDPSFKLNDANLSRDVPSFKWLKMVSQRHEATTQIVRKMNEAGHYFIGGETNMVKAIKKIWFTMDMPRNGARIGTMHNTGYWTDKDIFMAVFFLIKLDMRFTDPIEGTGEKSLRQLMLGQRGLYQLRDLLTGKLNKIQLLQMWVMYDYTVRPENRHLPVMGVPPNLIGHLCQEGWGYGTGRLLRPDELLVREGVRRSLNLHMKYIEILRWGHIMQSVGKKKSELTRFRDRRPLDEFVEEQRLRMKEEFEKEKTQWKNELAAEQESDEAMLDAGEEAI
jgi:hypothetical protein